MNRDDSLQDMLVRNVFRRGVRRPQHFVPTAEGFGAAVRAGLGWGMFLELSAVVEDLAELSYQDQYVLGADRLIAGLAADLAQSSAGHSGT